MQADFLFLLYIKEIYYGYCSEYRFLTSRLSPEKYLRLIGEAGFTHLHWCHQWNTDYLYSTYEIAQCKKWLQEYGLKLLDIHGSMG